MECFFGSRIASTFAHSKTHSRSEELANDLPRCGDDRSPDFERGQLEGKALKIDGTQIFVAGQKYGTSKGSSFGEDLRVVDLGRREQSRLKQTFGDFPDIGIAERDRIDRKSVV